jgi:hypothetical protein
MDTLPLDGPDPGETNVVCTVHKMTYSDGRAYRYLVSDDSQHVQYVAKRTGMLQPSPTRLVEFFDTQEDLAARLQPPDLAPWLRGTKYALFVEGEAEEPYAVIREHWRLVDILLLRLPRYDVQVGEHRYVVRGSRYGSDFYGIFVPQEKPHTAEVEAEEQALDLEPEQVEAAEPEGFDEIEDIEEMFDTIGSEDAGEEDDLEQEAESQGTQVGRIVCPTAGPSYVVEATDEPLRETPLLLAALVALIDMEQHS